MIAIAISTPILVLIVNHTVQSNWDCYFGTAIYCNWQVLIGMAIAN